MRRSYHRARKVLFQECPAIIKESPRRTRLLPLCNASNNDAAKLGRVQKPREHRPLLPPKGCVVDPFILSAEAGPHRHLAKPHDTVCGKLLSASITRPSGFIRAISKWNRGATISLRERRLEFKILQWEFSRNSPTHGHALKC